VTAAQRPWAACSDGLVVSVRLTPRGGRDLIEGIELLADGRSVLKARVRAAATEGEATARLKRLHIDGDSATLGAALALVADAAP
jgi:uncharacterized protein